MLYVDKKNYTKLPVKINQIRVEHLEKINELDD
jgi:hypothetical protein